MQLKKFNLGWISKYKTEIFAVAIILIMLFHFSADYRGAVQHGKTDVLNHPIIRPLIMKWWQFFGSIGVEVFVFLSGVGLYYSFSNNNNLSAFYKKRFLRIMPAYLIVASVFWAIKDFVFKGTGFEGWLADISFYSFLSTGIHTIWYIALMIVLYIAFPLIYNLIEKNEKYFVLILLLTLIIPIITFKISPLYYKYTAIATTRIPIFVFGVWMARYIKKNKQVSYMLIFAIIAFTFILNKLSIKFHLKGYMSRYVDSIFAIGVILLIIIFIMIVERIKIINWFMKFAGTLSLELYLTHVTLRNLMKEFGFHAYSILQYFIMLMIATVLSYLLKLVTDKFVLRSQP